MKKIVVLITLSVLIVTGLILSFYFWINKKDISNTLAIQAIPIDASIVLKVDDYAQFNQSLLNSDIWKSIGGCKELDEVTNFIRFTDSLYNSSTLLKKLLAQNILYVAFNTLGNKTDYLISVKVPQGISNADIYSLSKLQAIGQYKDSESTYNKTSIITFEGSISSNSVSVSINRGILIVSSSKLLVEKAINQIDNNASIINNTQFLAISKTTGKGLDANLYVNLKHISQTIKPLLNGNFRNGAETLNDIAQWIELDINFSGKSMLVSGLSTVADSTNSYLRILSNQKPVNIDLPNILPAETGIFIWLGISDLGNYLEDYRSYLDRKGEVFRYTQNLSSLRNQLGTGIEDLIEKILENEIALAYLPAIKDSENDDWYIITRTNSASNTQQFFVELIEHFAQQSKTNAKNFISSFKIDNDKTYSIYQFPVNGIYNSLLGSLFPSETDRYFCFIENYVVFGNSPNSLSRFIKSYLRNNILQKDANYQAFRDEISKKSNFLFYINPATSNALFKTVFAPKGSAMFSCITENINKLAYQLIGGNNFIFNSLTIKTGNSQTQTSTQQVLWETKLDANPTIKPQIVINHNNNEKEILVQDSENNIYLINKEGRILWKKKIDNQIIGDITQIDLLKNRKLQYAFSTLSRLYVIDRNGKNVDGFPVLYNSPATNPLSVIDYDNNRNYRFFQACNDRKIYIFDTKGKLIKGWKFGKTETIVTDRIGFARVKGLDYLIVFDANRPYILNRKGEERVKLRQYFAKAPNSNFTLSSNTKGESFIVTTDTIGLVRMIYLNGKVDDVALKSFSKWHSFMYNSISANEGNDFIILDGKTLFAYSNNKNLLFQLKLKDELKPIILYFDFGTEKKIGLISADSNSIYLVNSNGKIDDSFPLSGSTPFTITKLNSQSSNMNLLVGSKQATIINYTVK